MCSLICLFLLAQSSKQVFSRQNPFVSGKVRGYIICSECGKRRVIYSAKKLSAVEERLVMRVQEELLYTCGSPLFPGGDLQDTVLVREGINCSSPMEATYYAGIFLEF